MLRLHNKGDFMSDKAAKKKQFILDTAKGVFSKKGYKDVTMKDIVDACEISRGGLYIYFDSTEAILSECLEADKFPIEALQNHPAGEALAMFLNEQKREILSDDNNLTVAVYEYLFMKYSLFEEDLLVKPKAETVLTVLKNILEKGAQSGEFYCEDSQQAAKNILYCIEGLKVASKTFGVSEKDVDSELLYILSGLIADE